MKVATEHYADVTAAPDLLNREVQASEQAAIYDRHVQGRLRGMRPQALRSAACMYTVTPDAGFLLDWLPGPGRVLLASACSGHGFKHSAGLGEAVARDMTEGGGTLAAFASRRLDRDLT